MAPPVILAICLLSLADLLVAVDPLHVPIVRLGSTRLVDLDELVHRVNVKYGFKEHAIPRRKRDSSSIAMTNQDGDASYFAPMKVGTPSQTLNVILDTGSSDLWFAGTTCRTCATQFPLFDPTGSSSFQGGTPNGIVGTSASLGSTIQIQYGSGSVSGALAEDTVTMGGFTISDQKFINVKTIQGNILAPDPIGASGLLGLAFAGIAQTQATPFWQQLLNTKQLTSPEMGFFLTRSTDLTTQDVPGGEFTLGGTNSAFFTGEIEFTDLTEDPPLFWSLPLASVKVNGKSVSIRASQPAAIDTGTSLIAGPTSDVAAIWAAVPGSGRSPSSTGFFNFPCNTQVTISFSFGGKDWAINPLDIAFAREPSDNTKCVGSIFAVNVQPGSGTPSWIIGDSFLKSVYSVFRATPPSVGFAQLSSAAASGNGNSTVSQSEALPTTSVSPPFTGLPVPSTVSGANGANTASAGTSAAPTGTGAAQSGSQSIKASLVILATSALAGIMLSF